MPADIMKKNRTYTKALMLICALASCVITGCCADQQASADISTVSASEKTNSGISDESEEVTASLSDDAEISESTAAVSSSSEEENRVLSSSEESVTTESAPTPLPTETSDDHNAEAADESDETPINAVPVESQHTVAIDPGHQGPGVDMSATEPNGPGSSVMKMKATSGTAGVASGVGEYALNLTISQQLQTELENRGYNVVLTRTSNDEAISNAERAQFANQSGADVYLRIHANGSEDSSTRGALALIGSASNPWVGSLYDDSYRLADDVLNSYCSRTGFANLGIQTTDTMTGINWAQEPVMILEMGFMTNPQEDVTMEDPEFQTSMVTGIADGLDQYFDEEQGTN